MATEQSKLPPTTVLMREPSCRFLLKNHRFRFPGLLLTPFVSFDLFCSCLFYCATAAYIMIKPDGVQRGIVGEIIKRFENRGYKIAALKMVHASEEHLEKHYKDLKGKKFFPGLIKYMASGPVVCIVFEGKDAVRTGRVLLGATNPLDSAPGTIRGDFAIDVGRNVCHGSDSVESAKAEIALWFGEQNPTIQYTRAVDSWVYE